MEVYSCSAKRYSLTNAVKMITVKLLILLSNKRAVHIVQSTSGRALMSETLMQQHNPQDLQMTT